MMCKSSSTIVISPKMFTVPTGVVGVIETTAPSISYSATI